MDRSLGLSHSLEKFAHDLAESAARLPFALHRLGVFDQADRGGELRVLESTRQAGHRLRVRDAGRQLEDFLRQMADSVQVAASTGDENSFANVIDERFFLELPLEQFKGFAQTIGTTDQGEAERIFKALSEGGQVQMPMTKTFFSPAFGMVTDRFGVMWMVIVDQN